MKLSGKKGKRTLVFVMSWMLTASPNLVWAHAPNEAADNGLSAAPHYDLSSVSTERNNSPKVVRGIGKGFGKVGKGISKVGKGIGKGVAAVGKGVGRGALAVGKGLGKGAVVGAKGLGKGLWLTAKYTVLTAGYVTAGTLSAIASASSSGGSGSSGSSGYSSGGSRSIGGGRAYGQLQGMAAGRGSFD